jgi:uncharacterized protein (TIGR02588 family)
MADVAMDREAEDRGAEGREERTPLLEWFAGGVGAALTLALLGVLGWDAYTQSEGLPPEVKVSLQAVQPSAAGFVAEFAAVNLSPATAASVEVEGVLSRDGEEVERAQATLDYVPGHSEKGGGLFFREDPREGALELRALGYQEP